MHSFAPLTAAVPTDALDHAFGQLTAASARILELIPRYADEKVYLRDGQSSISRWLVWRYGLRVGMAIELVRIARALESLPAIAGAHARGRLSFDQVQALSKFATAETDERWARRAPSMQAAALWREAERHRRVTAKDALDMQLARSLYMWWDDQRPMLHLEASLPTEQGEAVRSALLKRFERMPAKDATGEPVDPEARMADSLVEAVTGDTQPTTLVVHAAAEVLTQETSRKGPWLAEVGSGRRLCTQSVRRIACDASIEWMLESAGRPVGIGRRGRTVPPHMLRVLRQRDENRCRFTGCSHTRWLKAHHLKHWADGGGTDIDNLILLCHHHHQLLHEGGWRVAGRPSEELTFHDPRGQPLRL